MIKTEINSGDFLKSILDVEDFKRYSIFFISNTFLSNARLKLAKKKANAKQHPEIIRFIIMKIKMKIRNRSYRYDMNRPGFTHGHKYS